MRLTFDDTDQESPSIQQLYPDGYWHAETNNRMYDAVGSDPLRAVARLAEVLEEALTDATD